VSFSTDGFFDMRFFHSIFFLVALVSGASAAALVPVAPATPQPALPPAGLEVNQGQAAAGILFLCRGATFSVGVTAQSVLYSPLGAALSLVASNPNAAVSLSGALPGLVNSYIGASPQNWITGIPRYGTATLASVYPGVSAQYSCGANGVLTLNLSLALGSELPSVRFQIAQATSLTISSGSLTAHMGTPPFEPVLTYAAPLASQGSVDRVASFAVQSATTFGVAVQGLDTAQPLEISIQLSGNQSSGAPVYSAPPFAYDSTIPSASDAAGNIYYAMSVPDMAGNSAPFPSIGGVGCGNDMNLPIACSDVAVYKYSAAGVLQFVTYLGGQYLETAGFVGVAPNGSLVVAGTTDSANFPVTASAAQPAYAGPPAQALTDAGAFPGGNLFAAVLDSTSGQLQAATFLGGPNAATLGTVALGADGSLYFLPVWLGSFSADMPVTPGALQSACQGNPCQNGYVAHLSAGLDQLLYGTYLPGTVQATAQLYSDGSVYYAGTAEAGFLTTPSAYQTQNAGGYDGIIARLDPTGTKLLFATYYGTPLTDWILDLLVAPDGSVWAWVTSFYACCTSSQDQTIHLDATGSQLLGEFPFAADQMVVDPVGDLFALGSGNIMVSPGAILGGSCGGEAEAYVELNPAAQQLFATYLPPRVGGFDGADTNGTPFLGAPSGRVEVVQSQSTSPSAGCVVDAAAYSYAYSISPGELVTLFGSGMGPTPGVGFQLVNGQVPTLLGGTQVLVDGEPAPLLYASYGQINLVLPYSLPVGTTPTIQVVSEGAALNSLSQAGAILAGISLFQVSDAAVALNQDGTVNSPQNPSKPGSTVMLFGTGGGPTNPPSVEGQITPAGLWPLIDSAQVEIIGIPGGPTAPPMTTTTMPLTVEYAGGAPALISGVTQINVTLPNVIPAVEGYPAGTLPLLVMEPIPPDSPQGTVGFTSNLVTISVATD
jgi:uncharacterized protein (TIGR03437 family)